METVVAFLRSLRLDTFGQGYRQPPTDGHADGAGVGADGGRRSDGLRMGQVQDAETLSASVDLEDIIDKYDEPSRLSRQSQTTTTRNSEAGRQQTSQSYFSLSGGPIEDDTTSFYSALHDGFSLDQFDENYSRGGRSSAKSHTQDLLWGPNSVSISRKPNNRRTADERSAMLQPTHFSVYWYDLNFSVKPRTTLVDVWEDGKQRLLRSITSGLDSCPCSSRARNSYSVNNTLSNQAKDSEVSTATEPVAILRNVNGCFKSGELTAVMGPSGAGKTSLLNILSRRRETGFTGRLHVSDTNHRLRINAIPQHDNLTECLTVRENLMFASRLKNSNINHKVNVFRVSSHLGLVDCLDTRTKNLSGGQQKRLAIAQELLSQPDILVLDEPTSGLDSLTCLKTLSVLKTLVVASRKQEIDPIAIVLTIHQPQQEAFNLFDRVYVMANGGIAIYDGPPSQCVAFVEKYSGLKIPSPDYNPASFLVEIASGEYGLEPIEAMARQVRNEYKKLSSEKATALSKNLKASTASLDMIERASSVASLDIYSNGQQQNKPELYLDGRLVKSSSIDSGRFFAKTRILTERCWTTMWRDTRTIFGRVLFSLLIPFGMAFLIGTKPGQSNACPRYVSEYSLVGIINSDEYTSEDVQEELLSTFENTGTIFVVIYSSISANIAAMTLMLALDMKSCLKEHYNGWYSMSSYILARLVASIPLELVLPTSTIAITYVVTGQNTGSSEVSDAFRILITSLAVIFSSCIGQIIGMLFGAIYFENITTALFASQGATLPFILLSGFVTRTKNMSLLVRLLGLTSLYRHCLDVAFIARYGWGVCECDPKSFVNKEVQLTGVSDELRNFVKYWMSSQDESNEIVSGTTNFTVKKAEENEDMFQMLGKQISLYNTYGIEVKSCDQVRPYELYDYGLTEADLPFAFASLVSLLLFMLTVVLLVVKFVTQYRTSL